MENIEILEKKVKDAVRIIKTLKEENAELHFKIENISSKVSEVNFDNKKFERIEIEYNKIKENERIVKKSIRELISKINKYRR